MAIDADAINRAFVVTNDGNGNALQGRYAVVAISGPLMQRATWWDGYDAISERFGAALADPNVDGVLVRIDSPGGMVAGCFEAVKLMTSAKAAAGKPVVAYVDECCCSAAYALATVADSIVLPPSGAIGSVGVIATASDISEALKANGVRVAVVTSGARKADGHPAVPMSDTMLARLQSDVDELASQFFDLVAASRGITSAAVSDLDAGVFLGQQGVNARLADRVGGFADAMATLDTMARTGRQTFAAVRPRKNNMSNQTPEVLISVADHSAAVEAAVAGALAKASTDHAAAVSALQSASVGLAADLSASRAECDAANAKLAALDAHRVSSKVDALIGKKAGLTPATRDKWLALASANEEAFDAIVADLPSGVLGAAIVPPEANNIRGTDAGASDKRNEKYLSLVAEKVKAGIDRNDALGLVIAEHPELLEEG